MICFRCQELENEGKKTGKEWESSIFKSLHAASIVNWEILHKKKGYDADQKKNIPFTYSAENYFPLK